MSVKPDACRTCRACKLIKLPLLSEVLGMEPGYPWQGNVISLGTSQPESFTCLLPTIIFQSEADHSPCRETMLMQEAQAGQTICTNL